MRGVKCRASVIAMFLSICSLAISSYAGQYGLYVNAREVIEREEFKDSPDHTEAIRAAFAEAAESRRRVVVFPAGNYSISDTIDITGAGEIIGYGYPLITQSNPEKDIFYQETAWRKTIRGLQFSGGRDQVVLGNANVNEGFLIISDCRFRDSEGAAVRFMGGPGYEGKMTASTYCVVEKSVFRNNAQVLISVSDDAHFKDAWISTKPHRSNVAVIENYGNLHIQNILGVPRVTGTDQRWIDNHGGVSIKKFRFGGEGAGFTPVVNFGKGFVILENSDIYALGNNKRPCAVYLEDIPSQLIIRDNRIGHVKPVIIGGNIDLETYFDDVIPGEWYVFQISGNIGHLAHILPDELIKAAQERRTTTYDYGERQLSLEETEIALEKAVARASEIPSAPAGEMSGRRQQTDPSKHIDIRPSTHAFCLDDYLDGITERTSDYLAFTEAGEDIILMQRIDDGTSYPHIRVRGVRVNLDETPFISWRLKDNNEDVRGGMHTMRIINNETGESVLPVKYGRQYDYNAFDLRELFAIESGEIDIDIKFYLLKRRFYGAMADDYVFIRKGEYFIIDFIRLEAE